MDDRTKELVAIAASVAGHCQPCFYHRLARAENIGADGEEAGAAIELAKRISSVGDQRMAELIDNVLKERAQEEKQ